MWFRVEVLYRIVHGEDTDEALVPNEPEDHIQNEIHQRARVPLLFNGLGWQEKLHREIEGLPDKQGSDHGKQHLILELHGLVPVEDRTHESRAEEDCLNKLLVELNINI